MLFLSIFFFNDTAPTKIYTLSLHDALPIFDLGVGEPRTVVVQLRRDPRLGVRVVVQAAAQAHDVDVGGARRSEEHTSELQSHSDLVCRLLLEKKKKKKTQKRFRTITHDNSS